MSHYSFMSVNLNDASSTTAKCNCKNSFSSPSVGSVLLRTPWILGLFHPRTSHYWSFSPERENPGKPTRCCVCRDWWVVQQSEAIADACCGAQAALLGMVLNCNNPRGSRRGLLYPIVIQGYWGLSHPELYPNGHPSNHFFSSLSRRCSLVLAPSYQDASVVMCPCTHKGPCLELVLTWAWGHC